jgi:hypothetical protein
MTERERRSAWPATIGGIFLALIGYVLSTGPILWLGTHNLIPPPVEPVLEWFYAPLIWLYDHGPEPIHTAFDWYFDFWG